MTLSLKNQRSTFRPELRFLLPMDRDEFSHFLHSGKERVQGQSLAHPEQLLDDDNKELR